MELTTLLAMLVPTVGCSTVFVLALRSLKASSRTEIDRLETEIERMERMTRRLEREHDEEYLRRVRAESRLDRVLTSVEQAGLQPERPSPEAAGEPDVEAPRPSASAFEPPVSPWKREQARSAASQKSAQDDSQGPCLSGKRVLLAEDGEDTQRLVDFLLRGEGATVVTVSDGASAVRMALRSDARGESFDLILMDRGLPVRNGLEATRDLRDGHYGGLIVALSASDREAERAEALDAGCDAFIAKPLSPATFARSVARVLEAAANGDVASASEADAEATQPVPTKRATDALAPRAGAAADSGAGEPILSEYAQDEAMAELVVQFVDDLVRDMRELGEALEGGDLERVQVLAHQLKGSAGSYGFNELTKPAEELERKARGAGAVAELEADISAFRELCARVQAPGQD